MKKYLTILLGILLLSGCKKEGEVSIIGVWNIDYSYYIDGGTTYRHTDWELTWDFREDGTGFQDGDNFIYKISGKSLSIVLLSPRKEMSYDILDLGRNNLEVAYHSETGNYIHYIFTR